MFDNLEKQYQTLKSALILICSIVGIFAITMIYFIVDPKLESFNNKDLEIIVEEEQDLDTIENGIHLATGFVDDKGLKQVINNCTNCHSSQLVIQNRMSKERWRATIKWMQETQNLWDLGDNEEIIVNYLAKHYAPKKKGRREGLKDIEWYELEN